MTIKLVRNSTDTADTAEVMLYDEIGWFGISAKGLADEIKALDVDEITLRVNSPGGDVYDGIAIMNSLRTHPARVTAVVEGLAASAASFIVVGGADHLVMHRHSELMIHDAMTWADGNAEEISRKVKDLDRISDNLAEIYAGKAGGEVSQWRDRMREETWYSAQEALDEGLADEVLSPKKNDDEAKNHIRGRSPVLAKFRYSGRDDAPAPIIDSPLGQKEATMAFEKDIAQMLGLKNASQAQILAALKTALPRNLAEDDVVYPATEIAAGDIAEVSPEGEVAEDMTFSVSGPEGWDVEVEQATGVVTVSVPEDSEAGESTIDVTVSVGEESVTAALEVTVTAAGSGGSSGGDESGSGVEDRVVLDKQTFEDLKAAAALGWDAKAKSDKAARAAQVDKWVKEGRVNPAHRASVVASMEKDEKAARDLYGNIPRNTIPVVAIGHDQDPEASAEAEAESRKSRAGSLFTRPRI